MSSTNTLYQARLARIRDAVAMRPVDKIPVSINGPAFVAHAQGLTLKQAITDYDKAAEAAIGLMDRLGTADSIQTPIIWPESLATLWMSKVSSPGFELPDDELWQVEEAEVISFDDYQYILDHGFAAFRQEVLTKRLHVDLDRLAAFGAANPVIAARCARAGVPVINSGGNTGSPFEPLCGGRSLVNFFMDLMDEPELLARVFQAVQKDLTAEFAAQLDANAGTFGAWVGGWRAAPGMLSDDIFDEFVWPYLKELALLAIRRNIVPIFHLDSCWDRAFVHFKELPPRTFILSLDGTSDIRLCRATVGDHAAIMGDVPATLLAFGTAGEVYDYTTRLIDDVGPRTGLIVCSGCDIPFNAKFENVKAMVDAAADFRV